MIDTNQERKQVDKSRVARVVARLREVQAMNPEQYQQWRADSAEAVRKANCAFCKKYPKKCKP